MNKILRQIRNGMHTFQARARAGMVNEVRDQIIDAMLNSNVDGEPLTPIEVLSILSSVNDEVKARMEHRLMIAKERHAELEFVSKQLL
jgi:hypothetical protein